MTPAARFLRLRDGNKPRKTPSAAGEERRGRRASPRPNADVWDGVRRRRGAASCANAPGAAVKALIDRWNSSLRPRSASWSHKSKQNPLGNVWRGLNGIRPAFSHTPTDFVWREVITTFLTVIELFQSASLFRITINQRIQARGV